jgi:AhpC/TSA family
MQLDVEILETVSTNTGETLQDLIENSSIFICFLRHFGCTFCRESLSDVADLQPIIENAGLKIVLVHMSDDSIADDYLHRYKLKNIQHISDPDKSLYDYFGLMKGNFWQLYGLKIWARGLKAGLIDGHGLNINPELGDFTQMPGIFIVSKNRVVEQFIHRSAADRPDYSKMIASFLEKKKISNRPKD